MAYMIARVAKGYGQPFPEVSDWAWSDVLRAGMALDELERVDHIRQDGDALELAIRIATATNNPKASTLIHGLRQAIRDRYRLSSLVADQQRRTDEQATLDALMQMNQRAARIARRKPKGKGSRGGTL